MSEGFWIALLLTVLTVFMALVMAAGAIIGVGLIVHGYGFLGLPIAILAVSLVLVVIALVAETIDRWRYR